LAFENSGGIGIECPVCHKFGQVITPKDVEAAELILFDYLNKHRILHRFLRDLIEKDREEWMKKSGIEGEGAR
jgi:hypothetical protein